MTETSTNESISSFRDWRNISDTAHRLTNAEILEQFGNPTSYPDTNNATCIRVRDVSRHDRWLSGFNPVMKRRYYTKSNGYNDGTHTLGEENKAYSTYLYKCRLTEAISSRLELSPGQRGRVLNQVLGLHLGKYGVLMELVIHCICAYTVHSDYKAGRSIWKCNPEVPQEERAKQFVALEQHLIKRHDDITESRIKSVYGKVQYDLGKWPRIRGPRRLPSTWKPNGARKQMDKRGMSERGWTKWDNREKRDAAVQATV